MYEVEFDEGFYDDFFGAVFGQWLLGGFVCLGLDHVFVLLWVVAVVLVACVAYVAVGVAFSGGYLAHDFALSFAYLACGLAG